MRPILCKNCGHPIATRRFVWKHISYESGRESTRTKCDECGCTNAEVFHEERHVSREVMSVSPKFNFIELHGMLGEHMIIDFKNMTAMINGGKMRPIVEFEISFRMRAKFDP